ncbi:MAG TPA: glutathione-regulated potassium-efflux system protein KefC [Polyangiales bacterium]|nr:glutathione-regulated potassium-efflux system protein KefC [Polyangiales bacterium]
MAHGMMVDALIFLGAAVVCVPIASRLKLGSVLGYLAAGCIIGPQALALVADPHAILEFAELGVVLMLFVIGLELDPRRLWELRGVVFVGGALQLAVTAGALTAGGLAVGLPWQASLIAALALSLSSTAIAMQTMGEKNLNNTPLGRGAFGVLLFQDLAAVPIMSLVPLLAPAGSVEPFQWANLGKGVLAILLVVGVGRYATRPMLNIAAQTNMREVFTAISLLLVLGIAQVMALAGLSMALGAFLAGVLLAGSEYRRALETDIEPFKGLLMGLFFIAVGMSVDFALLAQKPGLVLGLLAGFQVLKLGALRVITPRFQIAGTQRLLFASLLAQGGEFAFVVFGVARASKALPSDYEGVLTLVVALSMALTPFLIILCDRIAANHADEQAKEYDSIEDEGAQVIIAGFGRFGQIVGRLLLATGHRATVLDHDPDAVQTLRKFGFRVFYGDATRMDLLEAAGIAHAKVLVNAIDDQEDSLELVDAVREKFPKLPILARARNVTHYYELRLRGVEIVERETFESALALGRRALEQLGRPPYEAQEISDRFKRHNVQSVEAMTPHYNDEAKRLTMAKAGREELEAQFERDRELRRIGVEGPAWQRDEGGT